MQFCAGNIKEKSSSDRAYLADERRGCIYQGEPEFSVCKPPFSTDNIKVVNRADLVVSSEIKNKRIPSSACKAIKTESKERVSSKIDILTKVCFNRSIAEKGFGDRESLGKRQPEGVPGERAEKLKTGGFSHKGERC